MVRKLVSCCHGVDHVDGGWPNSEDEVGDNVDSPGRRDEAGADGYGHEDGHRSDEREHGGVVFSLRGFSFALRSY